MSLVDGFPDEDSPDLSDEEIAGAQDTYDQEDFFKSVRLLYLCCPSCELPLKQRRHQRRRRKPDVFSRVVFTCAAGHESVKTFKVNWLLRGT